ncbi:MAG TPA: hypothetical protein DGT23_21740 [Micromonosporaceae bacterium]|nr:hypothetical protein [Micromonosporaceae bacterium]
MTRLALVVLLLVSGCASPAAPSPSPSQSAPLPSSAAKEPVAVTVTRTGGIAGIQDTIKVDASGKWTRQDRGGRLTIEQVTQLQRLATDPRLVAEAAATRPPTNCADAFDYTVTAGPLTVRYSDCPSDALPPAAAELVSFVVKSIPA